MGQPRKHGRVRPVAITAAAVAVLSGCSGTLTNRQLDSVNVSSPRLREERPLPKQYACDGVGNPPLRWSNIPANTKSIALVVDDNNSQEGAAVQWVVFDIDPRTTELIESGVPQGARQGRVTSGKVGYQAPCRTDDSYRFSVYALDSKLGLPEGAPLSQTLESIANGTIARGRLTTRHIE
jgi:Raf kinase inhibitor-like YbhB/YbcL family protein